MSDEKYWSRATQNFGALTSCAVVMVGNAGLLDWLPHWFASWTIAGILLLAYNLVQGVRHAR